MRAAPSGTAAPASPVPLLEPLLLASTPVTTFAHGQLLTSASGFFFERDGRLFLVTSRHVLFDAASGHAPDSIGLTLHTDAARLAQVATLWLDLYRHGTALWRQGCDVGGDVDVAALEIDRAALPPGALLTAFGPGHLLGRLETVKVGTPLLLVGFPLGFHDTVHHLPVVRHAVVASAFGVRFQGEGYFLTDARAHRGSSGSPVVLRSEGEPGGLGCKLLGVHSSRMDMGGRDLAQDESLGLNCAWYADILLALTARA